jgi:hypothetical protein
MFRQMYNASMRATIALLLGKKGRAFNMSMSRTAIPL